MGSLFSTEKEKVVPKPSLPHQYQRDDIFQWSTTTSSNASHSKTISMNGTSSNITAMPINRIILQGTSNHNYSSLLRVNSNKSVSLGSNNRGFDYRNSLKKSIKSNLRKSILELSTEWDDMYNVEFELINLFPGSDDYTEIRNLFKKSTQKHFQVTKIFRIQNPYLLGYYLLKKAEMESRYGYVSERYLFHGTKAANKEKICRENFDWRRHGNSVGNIFGKGVSFTPVSCYASHYSDNLSSERLMFVSKVLVATQTEGNKDMELPPVFNSKKNLRYDTTIKPNGQVLVKFCDNEFYPSYIVYYTGHYQKSLKTHTTYY